MYTLMENDKNECFLEWNEKRKHCPFTGYQCGSWCAHFHVRENTAGDVRGIGLTCSGSTISIKVEKIYEPNYDMIRKTQG